MAKSVADALKKEKKSVIDDCWLDEKWLETNDRAMNEIGFRTNVTRGKRKSS